ncbi:haloacid dehalogenase-like hydrolase domain-containing protein 3 isoform X2 [Dreissena polymorpha]|uniref:Haloacid dehalogenase-like hydrolase domain-containing protein 3 n=2 Tax=Dreissena polymorpha TaxID=45954 RepID=A0A9D4EET2_DREPO|nr:haloacid dehalogenase-like hydrolase domain-containing protein 3 isoform X2 [Dreissena polymorpha]XP_052229710.1 haloacid dehalogenase-like hydrolase domain-containing protein 3 isoform X2 [Dreissena polymorpha]XP_052229711.1 haloacid dehalogenase-like hydrolase domain-containing protein 3 isoform X2 [Dreissena polymorpha]XP_052229713.1 haloacid dehalogenase-like hydrolase domain-containing protein 3 isoform X2 [Dreissena polymorpha]KAH3778150.1 hypothetical protein DPMN_179603 [Dreissena po
MSPIKLVTFDVTNTIIKILGGVGHNYAKVASLYGKNIDALTIDKSFRVVYKRNAEMYPNFGVNHGLTASKWWDKVVTETLTESGSDHENLDKIAKHLFLHFSTNQGWEVVEDAVETLSKLKAAGMQLGVISNFDERLEKILMQLALRHFFDFVICSATARFAKPDAGIFHLALEKAGVKACDAVHIGDHVVNDYNGSMNVGINGILYASSIKNIPENIDKSHIVSSLLDVIPIVTGVR